MADKSKSSSSNSSATSPETGSVSRRGVLKAGTAAVSLGALGRSTNAAARSDTLDETVSTAFSAQREAPSDRPYNLILFISDEEAYHLRQADGYTLPGRTELIQRGTTFHSHYIGAAMCTPSRGVMFSGQPPQINGIYDQMELGYVPSLSTDRPSMGTIFKSLGYETAYFGKFELRKDIITPKDDVNYTDALREFGFDTFAPDGDKVGGPDQAYDTDTYTGGAAIRWLRTNAQELNRQGKPWLLIVSFVSPHDIMYANANMQGKDIQASQVGMRLTPPPDNAHFEKEWDFTESPSHFEPMDAPGRPPAHLSYKKGWSAFLGDIPVDDTQMWRKYYNYYLNLIQDNDRNLKAVVDTLSALDMWDSTVVVRTADHGELGGSHGGLRGKGPLPYEQETHVPAVIVHPEHPGGRDCHALTSHIDLIPTLVGLTSLDDDTRLSALSGLPGKDFTSLLENPETRKADAVREAILFNYVGLQTVDWHYMKLVCHDITEGRFAAPFTEIKPDMSPRGFVNFVFDGRYKFARYYAPDNFNTPETFEALLANNDIELFDLKTDPDEMQNLGADPQSHRALILRMNDLLNRMIAREVGKNDGSFLPQSLRS